MEIGGWVQVSLMVFVCLENRPKIALKSCSINAHKFIRWGQNKRLSYAGIW